MIQYVCPKCGAEVQVVTVCTYPATICYRCTKCDYHHDDQSGMWHRVLVAPLDKVPNP